MSAAPTQARMRVLYVKQFFSAPEAPGSTQPRALVKALADRGHEVWVIACDYNAFTEKKEPPEAYLSPSGGSYEVVRRTSPRNLRKNVVTRLHSYSRFAVEILVASLDLPPPDVVIGSIQPLFAGASAAAVARRHRAAFLLEVRDLWPDALEVKGVASRRTLLPLYGLARLLYREAEHIVSSTPGIKSELLKKGVPSDKIDVFPNGFLPELGEVSDAERRAVRERYGWGDDFVAIYTGTHTEVTAIDVLVKAAAALRDEPGLRVVLFGSGQTKEPARRLARELGLSNITFYDPVPVGEVPALLAAAAVALMTLFSSPLINIYFQNKFMTYMGMGKPILAAMEGEQAEIIRRAKIGRVVPTFDHAALAELVREARHNPEETQAMGQRGAALVRERLLLPHILARYVDRVEHLGRGENELLPIWEPVT